MRCALRRSCLRKPLRNRQRPSPLHARTGRIALSLAILVGIVCAGCGYHVAGRASRLPSDWSSIAIPAFKNDTTRYRIEQRLTEAVIREFIERTKVSRGPKRGIGRRSLARRSSLD